MGNQSLADRGKIKPFVESSTSLAAQVCVLKRRCKLISLKSDEQLNYLSTRNHFQSVLSTEPNQHHHMTSTSSHICSQSVLFHLDKVRKQFRTLHESATYHSMFLEYGVERDRNLFCLILLNCCVTSLHWVESNNNAPGLRNGGD